MPIRRCGLSGFFHLGARESHPLVIGIKAMSTVAQMTQQCVVVICIYFADPNKP